MRNDTKVGIVVGLVIVVVASVYFYGNSRTQDDLLVEASAPRVELSPRIPAVPDSVSSSDSGIEKPVARPGEHVVALDGGARGFGRPAGADASSPDRISPAAESAASSHREPPNRPGMFGFQPDADGRANNDNAWLATGRRTGDVPPSESTGTRYSLEPAVAAVTGNGADEPSRPASATALRSGSSSLLDDSIRANLADRSDKPTATHDRTESGAFAGKDDFTSSWPRVHHVQAGDTLYGIMQQYYGSAGDLSRIMKANPQVRSPRSLKVGMDLTIPDPLVEPKPQATASAARPNAAEPRRAPLADNSYAVREGDTFYTIARDLYGDGRRWNELFQLNKALVKDNPKRLKPGMTIRLPG